MYLEYDWMIGVFRPRFGDTFTKIRDESSYSTMKEARQHLKACGLKVGRRTDTRTWEIVRSEED